MGAALCIHLFPLVLLSGEDCNEQLYGIAYPFGWPDSVYWIFYHSLSAVVYLYRYCFSCLSVRKLIFTGWPLICSAACPSACWSAPFFRTVWILGRSWILIRTYLQSWFLFCTQPIPTQMYFPASTCSHPSAHIRRSRGPCFPSAFVL